MAAWDVQTWQVLVRDQLPEGSVFIAYQSVPVAADVWVVWRDPAVVVGGGDAPTTASECPTSLTVTADPSVRCSYFRINL